MVDERYHDEHTLTEDKSIAPGNAFWISYTFPDAGAMKVSIEEFSGQTLYFSITDEENAKRYLEQTEMHRFDPEATGEIPRDAARGAVQTYIKPGEWYVLIQNPEDNQTATGLLEVEYIH